MKDRLRDKLWEIVEECVNDGVSLDDFVGEFKECWRQAHRDMCSSAIKEVNKLEIEAKL